LSNVPPLVKMAAVLSVLLWGCAAHALSGSFFSAFRFTTGVVGVGGAGTTAIRRLAGHLQ
jgi:hypothetical protein